MRRAAFLLIALFSSPARGEPPGPVLAPAPWSLALDAVAGNGVLFTGSRDDAHPVLGGLLRARFRALEVGGYGEWTPHEVGDAHDFGALAGAFLPYRRWLDFELAGTFGQRVFANADTRYGAHGLSLQETTVGARAGVSARAGSLFAVRVGAMLAIVSGVTTHDVPFVWAADDAGSLVVRGSRRIGGTDVMLLFTVGVDVTPPY